MKKILSFALAALMTGLLFTGCQSLPKISVSSKADLADLKIGTQDGTTGQSLCQKEISSNTDNVKGYKSAMDAALALKNGTVDAVVIDELPAKSIVAQNNDLTILDLELSEPEGYAIAVKKGNTELLEQINATLKRMKEDGTYDALGEAFIPSDGEIKVPEDKATEGDGKIIMGTNASFPPFEYLDGTRIVGFDISMSQEIAADMGKKLEVSNMDFNALLGALSTGQIDFVAAGMTVEPDRLENADFSDVYFTSKQVVIVRK